MDINSVPDNVWQDTISGKLECNFKFLALRVLLTRLSLSMKSDSSPEAMKKNIVEIKNFFIKTQNIPVAQEDFQKIVDKGGVV